LDFTGERYVSGIEGFIRQEHYHRYLIATSYCRGKRVLDAACGEGYGSRLLAELAESVIGVDVDPITVAYAQRTYGSERARFLVADVTKIPLEDRSFDVVVSFETIEHLQDHAGFLAELKRLLLPGGVAIVSSPNRTVYTERNEHKNPFHLRELDREEFRAAINAVFPHVKLLEQRPICGSVVMSEDEQNGVHGYETQDGLTYRKVLGVPSPFYFIAVASLDPLPGVENSLLYDETYIPRLQEREACVRAQAEERAADDATELMQAVKAGDDAKASVHRLLVAADEQAARATTREDQLTRALRAQAQSSEALELRIKELELDNGFLKRDVDSMKSTWAWRVMSALRLLSRNLFAVPRLSNLGTKLGAAWRHPVDSQKRKRFRLKHHPHRGNKPVLRRRSRAAGNLGAILRHPVSLERRRAYRARRALAIMPYYTEKAGAVPDVLEARLFSQQIQNIAGVFDEKEFVPLAGRMTPSSGSDVKLVAYYLPQYHPIAENNEWWGPGFTEWRNVARGYPTFSGHYQPRVPGELGYYDLRLVSNLRRQAELARQHGIHAFCFHFYWFGGRRLLELPIQNFLANKDVDLNFSLCWANENWSRRWDGGNNEILIGQDHSPEDDVEFIRYVSKYFADGRYMKIDGKPVLTVYRPSIMPDIKDTIARWRKEVLGLGYPGLYLIATNAFGFSEYEACGFDALSEFPPHALEKVRAREDLAMSPTRTGGIVYDYRSTVQTEMKRSRRLGTVHPGAMPGWDNSARKPHDGHVAHGATPILFAEWLDHGVQRASRNPDGEQYVFINAWNEWAEGAYLEPDARFGYGYLQATASVIRQDLAAAIIVHAFYPDVLDEIMELVVALPAAHKLFITTVSTLEADVRSILDRSGRSFTLRVVENRGRDVLPFLSILSEVQAEGFEYCLKVHTKKSLHRGDGCQWREAIFEALLSPPSLRRSLLALSCNPHLGMIGPEEHFISTATFIGSNAERVWRIAEDLHVDVNVLRKSGFFAGTMFIARVAALIPLLELACTLQFESEEGQTDGTLAHALERAMPLSVHAAGMTIASIEELERIPEPKNAYRFAQPSVPASW
jgi:lipopolysaccharide biosynthesis protein/ubiquinone/menaquinone biosynthesis C-methylase UbiE